MELEGKKLADLPRVKRVAYEHRNKVKERYPLYIVGEVTAEDKKKFLDKVKKKVKAGKELNKFEKRAYELDKKEPGSFPVMTDRDTVYLLSGGFAEIIQISMSRGRRERASHLRERKIFYDS